jgi:tripartite-type tricarboxylate transporter receptor subunit TctC
LFAPANTPKDIVAKFNTEVVRILQEKEIAQRFEREGAEPAPGTPDQLAKYMRSEHEQWKKTIAAAKIRMD